LRAGSAAEIAPSKPSPPASRQAISAFRQPSAHFEGVHIPVDPVEPAFAGIYHQTRHQRPHHREDVGDPPHRNLGIILPAMGRQLPVNLQS
jgi:hypothetical protein